MNDEVIMELKKKSSARSSEIQKQVIYIKEIEVEVCCRFKVRSEDKNEN